MNISSLSYREYTKIHEWIKRNRGIAKHCSNESCEKLSDRYHWAKKKDKDYDYNLDNFIPLCASCHSRYDRNITDPPKDYYLNKSSAETVKLIRKHLYLSQQGFGELFKVSKTAVYKWEKGIIVPTHPHIKNLILLAKKHKIKVKLEDFYNA